MNVLNFFKKPEEVRPNVVEFVCKVPACKFTVVARPTVRQQMEYLSATASANGPQMLTRYWEGAKALILDWKSETIPDFKIDTDKMDNPEQAELITWAALQVKAYLDSLENIPKNS